MKPTATVVWVHNMLRFNFKTLNALPDPPIQINRYLIVSIPVMQSAFFQILEARERYETMRQQTRDKMLALAKRWGVPASHCCLVEERLSPQLISTRLRQPVDIIHIGKNVFLDDLIKTCQYISSFIKKIPKSFLFLKLRNNVRKIPKPKRINCVK